MPEDLISNVMGEVYEAATRKRDEAGEEGHPGIDDSVRGYVLPERQALEVWTDATQGKSTLSWLHLVLAKLSGAVHGPEDMRRAFLVKLAGVVVAWIASIDGGNNGKR